MMSRLAHKLRGRLLPAPAVTAGILLASALSTGLGIALTNAEGLVTKGFTTALSASSGQKAGAPGSEALIAGSEEFWLAGPGRDGNASARLEPAAWTAQSSLGFSVGDRITIASGGAQRTLEVVDIAAVPASVTRLETEGGAGNNQVLVTCRDTKGGQDGELIRFVTYTGATAGVTAAAAGKPPRSL